MSEFPDKKILENLDFLDPDPDFRISVHGVVMGVQDLPTFITYSGSLFPRTLTFYFKPSPIQVVYFPILYLF